jgi:hypothetical protein
MQTPKFDLYPVPLPVGVQRTTPQQLADLLCKVEALDSSLDYQLGACIFWLLNQPPGFSLSEIKFKEEYVSEAVPFIIGFLYPKARGGRL